MEFVPEARPMQQDVQTEVPKSSGLKQRAIFK